MAYVEVTSQGWLSRIGNSIIGALIGLLLFVVSFPLLFWNEGRAVQTARSLEEGAGAVVTVPAERVDPAHEQKLVHLTGDARTDETLTDAQFGVAANAIKLIRDVEMYQWEEDRKSETRTKLGGGTETVTRYEYRQTWSSRLIDSGDFKERGHDNPTRMPFESTTQVAKRVTVGAFTLSPEQLAELDEAEELGVKTVKAASAREGKAQVETAALRVGDDAGSPEIGDVRIRFSAVKPGPVSLVALQAGDTFRPYQTKAGDTLLLVEAGTRTAEEMFSAAQDRNTVITWLLRAGGWLAMFIGLILTARPLSVIGDVVPFIGAMVGAGMGVFAFLISAMLSTVTIAFAWIAYRPLLGIGLLAVGGGAVALLVTRTRRRRAA